MSVRDAQRETKVGIHSIQIVPLTHWESQKLPRWVQLYLTLLKKNATKSLGEWVRFLIVRFAKSCFHRFYDTSELETYGAVVSTLRAQGELNKDRRKLLEDLSVLMKISPERHKAEIRRAVNDEKLGRIAER